MSAPAFSGTAAPDRSRLPVGATLDEGFAVLKRRPRALLGPAVLLHVVPMVAAVLLALLGWLLLGDLPTTTETVRESTFFGDSTLVVRETPILTDGQWVLVGGLAAIAGATVLWFSSAAAGAVIVAARRELGGEPPLAFGDAVRTGLRTAPRLVGLTLIVLAVALVAAVVAFLALRVLYRLAGMPLLGLGLLASLALVAVVATRLALFPVVAVVERRGLASFARTWSLSAGRFWELLGLLALLAVVVTAFSVVASLALEAAFGALNALDSTAGAWALIPYTLLSLLFAVVYVAATFAPMVVAHRRLAAGPVADDASASGAPPVAPALWSSGGGRSSADGAPGDAA